MNVFVVCSVGYEKALSPNFIPTIISGVGGSERVNAVALCSLVPPCSASVCRTDLVADCWISLLISFVFYFFLILVIGHMRQGLSWPALWSTF